MRVLHSQGTEGTDRLPGSKPHATAKLSLSTFGTGRHLEGIVNSVIEIVQFTVLLIPLKNDNTPLWYTTIPYSYLSSPYYPVHFRNKYLVLHL